LHLLNKFPKSFLENSSRPQMLTLKNIAIYFEYLPCWQMLHDHARDITLHLNGIFNFPVFSYNIYEEENFM
jgi:hypothetical protein